MFSAPVLVPIPPILNFFPKDVLTSPEKIPMGVHVRVPSPKLVIALRLSYIIGLYKFLDMIKMIQNFYEAILEKCSCPLLGKVPSYTILPTQVNAVKSSYLRSHELITIEEKTNLNLTKPN